MKRACGVVLVMVSGLLGLLILLALSALGAASLMGTCGRAAREAAAIRTCAWSGMEYASARLLQDPFPGKAASGPADDWTFRDGAKVVALPEAQNPSYGRGEPWSEGAPDDGIFVEGEPYADLDGDGRRTSWSGRLRGDQGARALRFRLRIGTPDGRIHLNGGALFMRDGLDNDHDAWIDEPGETADIDGGPLGANGIPDHCDPDAAANSGLVQALNSLGVLCGIATRRWDVPSGADLDGDGVGDGDPIPFSWLGRDLIACRPPEGYSSWKQAVDALVSLPPDPSLPFPFKGAPYTRQELERVRPFVEAGEMDPGPWCGRRMPPVSLHAAAPEVLASLWMHFNVPGAVAWGGETWPSSWLGGCFGEPEGLQKNCLRSRMPFDRIRCGLWREEAEALAAEAVAWRGEGNVSWRYWRQRLADKAASLFVKDVGSLSQGVATPAFRRSWVQAKASLSFSLVSPDSYPVRPTIAGPGDPLAAWASGGTDADLGVQPSPATTYADWGSVPMPHAAFDPLQPAWGFQDDTDEDGVEETIMNPAFPYQAYRGTEGPPAWTLAPPGRFEVECLAEGSRGGRTMARGRLSVHERLELSTQEDFEAQREAWGVPSEGFVPISRLRDIEVVDDPSPGARRGFPGPGPVRKPAIASLPNGFVRGYVAEGTSLASLRTGALALSGSDPGLGSAQLAWCFPEDFSNALPADEEKCMPAPGASRIPLTFRSDETMPISRAHLAFGRCAAVPVPGFETVAGDPDGMNGGPAMAYPELAIEAWMGAGSSIEIRPSPEITGVPIFLKLSSSRGWKGSPENTGVRFLLEARWPGSHLRTWSTVKITETTTKVVETSTALDPADSWFLPDPSEGPPGSYHVVMSMRREKAQGVQVGSWTYFPYISRFTLRANGVTFPVHDHWRQSELLVQYQGGGLYPYRTNESVRLEGVDEIRLYRTAAALPVPDRFVRRGTYISPLYRFGEPVRLAWAQWHLIVPRSFDGPGEPASVRLLGYDAGGVLIGDRLLPPGTALVDPVACGFPAGVRAFRYLVEFDCDAAGAPQPLLETPVFESIWLAYRPRGSSWVRLETPE